MSVCCRVALARAAAAPVPAAGPGAGPEGHARQGGVVPRAHIKVRPHPDRSFRFMSSSCRTVISNLSLLSGIAVRSGITSHVIAEIFSNLLQNILSAAHIIVRKEAEQLLRQDGDFLVRESQQPGPGPGQQNSRIENIINNNNNNILH